MVTAPIKLQTKKGYPTPYGVSEKDDGVNFALYSKHATSVTLCLFEDGVRLPVQKINLTTKTGDVWHVLIPNLPSHYKYAYLVDGPHSRSTYSFHPHTYLLDPYAKAVDTPVQWGEAKSYANYHPLGLTLPHTEFDWEGIGHPQIMLKNLVIYEMHVRGFTEHTSSKTQKPGTFLGVIEKIPHLLDLGINAVELLPIFEFNEMENHRHNPLTDKLLFNYWGYSTVNFFSLMNRYGSIIEFKTMVKELHRHGIEVILDVVFNHTAEGNELGPCLSFKGLDPTVYYLFNAKNHFSNYSGCGNSMNSNHPVVMELIRDSLRYWVSEMRVDGFRFDLASALTRGEDGDPLLPSPLIDMLANDPVLSDTKLIAEPWDAVGLYQVGDFYPKEYRWSEWNDQYKKSLRRFIKGVPGEKRIFATRLCGSQDLYGGKRSPLCSINYYTCHDGFSLYDLVSYNQKHNLKNGEDDRDGNPDNDSWNCGVEGQTDDPKILALRERQMKNFHLAAMLSQGVPMLLMGDEYQHTRRGNNNTYCQDNELNWFLWDQLQTKQDFFRFYKGLIHFRRRHPILRSGRFLGSSDITWHGKNPFKPEWDTTQQFLSFVIKDPSHDFKLYAAFNNQDAVTNVELPPAPTNKKWHLIVNTANKSPLDFVEERNSIPYDSALIQMIEYSAVLLTLR